jgi:hypothetical protein
MEEVFLSYLPGRSAQVRLKAVGDLAADGHKGEARHAH